MLDATISPGRLTYPMMVVKKVVGSTPADAHQAIPIRRIFAYDNKLAFAKQTVEGNVDFSGPRVKSDKHACGFQSALPVLRYAWGRTTIKFLNPNINQGLRVKARVPLALLKTRPPHSARTHGHGPLPNGNRT